MQRNHARGHGSTDFYNKIDQKQTHVISSFYALWMAIVETRSQPEGEANLRGVMLGRERPKSEEEGIEKAKLAFLRADTVPARVMNGARVRKQVVQYLRQVNPTAHWGIVRASGGESVVPDWPVHPFVPITPTIALINHPLIRSLDRTAVELVNKQLREASRRYFFARDFAACP